MKCVAFEDKKEKNANHRKPFSCWIYGGFFTTDFVEELEKYKQTEGTGIKKRRKLPLFCFVIGLSYRL